MANTVTYGFVGLEHLWGERVTTVGERVIYDAIRESAAEHTRQMNALLAGFVERTTDHKLRYALPGTGTLQPLDEYGNPRPVRPSGHYDVAFPIQGGGDAWGNNRITRALMTVEEANRHTLDAMARDADWVRRHLLAAMFDNVAWTYDDPAYGNLTIEPVANGDTVTYTRRGGSASTDTHFLAQAAAIDDTTDPYDDIYDELMEHPSNSGPIVVYIATSLKATTEALTAFVPIADPDIQYGTGVDQIAGAPGSYDDSIRGVGDAVLGKAHGCWIVEWSSLPSGYMIAHARGGGPVLAMREYPATSLQGFFPEEFSSDGNLKEMRMLRYAGFGTLNRVAALCYYVGGGAWAIPSGYGAPLAV
jgi:hypothetical protein